MPFKTPTTPSPLGAGLPSLALKRRKKYQLRRRTYCATPIQVAAGVAADPAVAEELERLRGEVARLEALVKDAEDKVLRGRAEFENQRRRHLKDKEESQKYATENLMRELSQPMDHFALALASLDTATEVKAVRQGVDMIHREFLMVLQNNGLEAIVPGNVPFDPTMHDAVATGTEPSLPDGSVLQVMRPGWSLRGRVIRPAMVKVNKLGTSASETG